LSLEEITKYKGTRKYIAPEVLNAPHYETKADTYSLGVILQELFNIDIQTYKEFRKNFSLLKIFLI
jgi:serine/threonine protein kinase